MILVERSGAVGVVTISRPEARNALTGKMMADLIDLVGELDSDDAIGAIVLTGADPAFCSGLDLKDLANTYNSVQNSPQRKVERRGLLPKTKKPIIGAINGPAVTGGLELALGCDWMIASREHATFADTHARVGVMPGGGMTIRLPQLIGVNRARQMSFTGNFINAQTAYEWGLVNEVVAHAELLTRALGQAQAICEASTGAIGELRRMYETLGLRIDSEAYLEEQRWSRQWMNEKFREDAFAARRDDIIARGSSQQDA